MKQAHLVLSLSAFFFLAPIGAAQAQPSFNCQRATTAVEREICGNSRLSGLDRQMARAYAQARSRLSTDRTATSALATDQGYFLATRERILSHPDFGRDGLATFYQERSAMLSSIVAPRAGWGGEWVGFRASTTITEVANRDRTVARTVNLFATEAVQARWVCEYGDSTRVSVQGTRMVANFEDDVKVTLTRRGALLTVANDQGATVNCGANGSVSGTYFPARAK